MVRSAVLGTFVADASGMGLHWIYSQGKIAQIAKSQPVEFATPDPANYEKVPAFFAHPHKRVGDGSNYGEYLYVLLRALGDGGFEPGPYIRTFQEYFGPGGEYVGYADTPMRETLYNLKTLTNEIEELVKQSSAPLSDDKKAAAAHYIGRYFLEYDTEGLKEKVRVPLRLQEWSKDELQQVDTLVDEVGAIARRIGPDDDQMPALSRSAVLAHFSAGAELDTAVEEAVRITNNNDDAVAASIFMARVMRELYETGRPSPADVPATLRSLFERHLDALSERGRELVSQALAAPSLDYRGMTKTFGAACHVHMAVPLVVHILVNTADFTEANRVNILASGDNCGRAIMLGAVAGAAYGIGGDAGIPEDWIARSTIVERARKTSGGKRLLGET